MVVALGETHPPERRIPFRFKALVGSLVEVTVSRRFHRVAWAASLSFCGQFLYIGMAPIVVARPARASASSTTGCCSCR